MYLLEICVAIREREKGKDNIKMKKKREPEGNLTINLTRVRTFYTRDICR